MPLFPRPATGPRPQPRPEDRTDLAAVAKGVGIAVAILLVVNFGLSTLFSSLLPRSAKDAINRRDESAERYNTVAKEATDLRKTADDASANNAPDAEARTADADAKQAEADALKAEFDTLDREAREAIPGGLFVASLVALVVLLAAGSVVGGYLTVRFTRGRRHKQHGLYAGLALMLLLTFLGGLFPNPVLIIVQSAAIIGGGWFGGQLWVRRNGEWDGTMPERPPSRFFAPRRPPADDEDLGERDDEIVDIDLAADEDLEGSVEPEPGPETDGPRAFGPRGRKKRRRRAQSPGDADDDIE